MHFSSFQLLHPGCEAGQETADLLIGDPLCVCESVCVSVRVNACGREGENE